MLTWYVVDYVLFLFFPYDVCLENIQKILFISDVHLMLSILGPVIECNCILYDPFPSQISILGMYSFYSRCLFSYFFELVLSIIALSTVVFPVTLLIMCIFVSLIMLSFFPFPVRTLEYFF